MKVYLGPYPRLIFNIRKFIINIMQDSVFDSKCSDWVFRLLDKLEKINKKREFVYIDDYDTWSADASLAVIIHPLLLKIKENKYSYAIIPDEDAPLELKDEARWNYVLDKMIYSFGVIKDDDYFAEDSEVQEGLNLFGKYYRALWT